MQPVELAEAKSPLNQLVESLSPGDAISFEKNHQPVARLLPTDASRTPCPLGEFAGKFRPLPHPHVLAAFERAEKERWEMVTTNYVVESIESQKR